MTYFRKTVIVCMFVVHKLTTSRGATARVLKWEHSLKIHILIYELPPLQLH